VDPDKAFAVQMTHEENVVEGPVAYLQCALLYTSSNGERRIRYEPKMGSLFVDPLLCGHERACES
jgi:hypothetical protein